MECPRCHTTEVAYMENDVYICHVCLERNVDHEFMGEKTSEICPECFGEGKVDLITNITYEGDVWSKLVECPECEGEGCIEEGA